MSVLKNLGFIGAGNMATAIRSALTRSGLVKASQVYVSCPEPELLEQWDKAGCNVSDKNIDVLHSSDTIIWAVKPQGLAQAAADTGPVPRTLEMDTKPFHISVLAGVPLLTFKNTLTTAMFDGDHERFGAARVMPNIAVKVGVGCAVYALGEHATEDHKERLEAIFSQLGICYHVPESQINAYCGLFSSGIGFMMPILEAMSDGAVKHGIPRDISVRLAAQTMKGAAELLLRETNCHPGQLKDAVCSPGGTTIAGVAELEKFGVRNALISAIQAATDKGDQLGRDCTGI